MPGIYDMAGNMDQHPSQQPGQLGPHPQFGSNAFPCSLMPSAIGLTKREYFAAAALEGLLSALNAYKGDDIAYVISRESIRLADALIAELGK
jgi:hypothetical protein